MKVSVSAIRGRAAVAAEDIDEERERGRQEEGEAIGGVVEADCVGCCCGEETGGWSSTSVQWDSSIHTVRKKLVCNVDTCFLFS